MQNKKRRHGGSRNWQRFKHELVYPDPAPTVLENVLKGTDTVKAALAREALKLPASTRGHCLQPGEEMDPVLRHHLRLD